VYRVGLGSTGQSSDVINVESYNFPSTIIIHFHRLLTEVMDSTDSKEHKYNEDDYKEVPEDIQKEIRKVILEDLFPDILKYMKAKGYLKFHGILIEHMSFEMLCSYRGSLKPAFEKEQQYELYLLQRHFCFPELKFCKIGGKELVGAAIRMSNIIKKPKYADKLREIVRGCFIPNDEPDLSVSLSCSVLF